MSKTRTQKLQSMLNSKTKESSKIPEQYFQKYSIKEHQLLVHDDLKKIFEETFDLVFQDEQVNILVKKWACLEALFTYLQNGFSFFSEFGLFVTSKYLSQEIHVSQNKIASWILSVKNYLMERNKNFISVEKDLSLDFCLFLVKKIVSVEKSEWNEAGLTFVETNLISMIQSLFHSINEFPLSITENDNFVSRMNFLKSNDTTNQLVLSLEETYPLCANFMLNALNEIQSQIQKDPFLIFLWRLEIFSLCERKNSSEIFYRVTTKQIEYEKKINLLILSLLYPDLNTKTEMTIFALENWIQKNNLKIKKENLRNKIESAIEFGQHHEFLFQFPFKKHMSYHLNEKGIKIFHPFQNLLKEDYWRNVFLEEKNP